MGIDSTAVMVGTDLPSTRARRPFRYDDFETIRRAIDPDQVAAVFWDNAAAFYLDRSTSEVNLAVDVCRPSTKLLTCPRCLSCLSSPVW